MHARERKIGVGLDAARVGEVRVPLRLGHVELSRGARAVAIGGELRGAFCGRSLSARRAALHDAGLHAAKGSLLRKVWERVNGKPVAKLIPTEPCTLFVTNRRVVVAAKKKIEIPLVKIDDVEVDVDPNVVTIRTAKSLKDVDVQLEDPVYTAALLDLAATLDERPRGFA